MRLIHFVTLFLLAVASSQPAYAYIDLGTGSLVLQMFIASIMGLLYTLKLYWYKVKVVVARILGKHIEEPSTKDMLDEDESAELKEPKD